MCCSNRGSGVYPLNQGPMTHMKVRGSHELMTAAACNLQRISRMLRKRFTRENILKQISIF